ncbi:WD40 repeat domain-containing protein [Fimbriiglobus ruber]|uniref:WD40 repeat domain-containing protein n=1 Tax=Fimbriiglobus ruber TaxID=1908690 RepID=UPI000B4B408C|nr:hypothetical protein [Fimbriiglobus ruber]
MLFICIPIAVLCQIGHKPIKTLECDSVVLSFAAFSPNGAYIASAGRDGIKVWETEGFKLKCSNGGHDKILYGDRRISAYVNQIIYFDNGSAFATIATDKTLRVWDAENCKQLFRVNINTSASQFAFLKGNHSLAMSDGSEAIKIWNIERGEELFEIGTKKFKPYAVTCDAKCEIMAIGNSDASLEIWNVAKRKRILNLVGHKEKIICVSFSSNGLLIASSDWSGKLIIWNAISAKQLFEFNINEGTLGFLQFIENDKYLLWADLHSDRIFITDISDGKCASCIFAEGLSGVCYDRNNRLIASWQHTSIKFWPIPLR